MYEQIAANKRRTIFLMLAFFGLVGVLAWLLSTIENSPSPFFIVGVFSLGYALWAYFGASRAALSMSGAQEIEKADAPALWRTVENLAITEGLPMPKVYIINDSALNAFATGRDPEHASVAITSGLLERLEPSELQGVMAHELGHIKNYDSRVNMIAFALVGVISLVSDIFLRMGFWGGFGGRRNRNNDGEGGSILFLLTIVALILAPIVATLMQLAISRRREYLADATGALTTRYPEGLARALEKIRDYGSTLQRQNTSTAHFFIANPLRGSISGLLSTHPPIEERIAILRGMDGVK